MKFSDMYGNLPLSKKMIEDYLTKSNIMIVINSWFKSNEFRIALLQDLYLYVCAIWNYYFTKDNKNPIWIQVFEADKFVQKTMDDLCSEINPTEELDLFEYFYNSFKDEVEQGVLSLDYMDFLVLELILVLNSGIVKKKFKRTYKTAPNELKRDLVVAVSDAFNDMICKTAKEFHPDYKGVRPLNALETKGVLYNEKFIKSFKRKRTRKNKGDNNG